MPLHLTYAANRQEDTPLMLNSKWEVLPTDIAALSCRRTLGSSSSSSSPSPSSSSSLIIIIVVIISITFVITTITVKSLSMLSLVARQSYQNSRQECPPLRPQQLIAAACDCHCCCYCYSCCRSWLLLPLLLWLRLLLLLLLSLAALARGFWLPRSWASAWAPVAWRLGSPSRTRGSGAPSCRAV